jgi:hypothetical protein
LREFGALIAQHQRRLRIGSLASAMLAACAAGGLAAVTLSMTQASAGQVRLGALATALAAMIPLAAISWRRWTSARVAGFLESRAVLHNLVVTAEEIVSGRRVDVLPVLRDDVLRQATAGLQSSTPHTPRLAPMVIGPLMAALALSVLLIYAPRSMPIPGTRDAAAAAPATRLARGQLRVTVTPPRYTGREATSLLDPATVTVVEGSRIRIEASTDAGRVVLQQPEPPVASPLRRDGEHWVSEFTPQTSFAVLVSYPDLSRDGAADRLLQVRVEPDARPVVRIRAPAKDLLFGQPRGVVPLEIEARDDIALQSLRLRYTRVSGSGETFTFQEGDLPIEIDRQAATGWEARGRIVLDGLGLADGDTIVYRAIASDARPGADPVASESYLIEIGRLAGAASTGFAVDEERDRQGLSQQMLIIKTERLHAERSKLTSDQLLEQSRLLAVEQRMVRAEFVFMTGGEVADEVEEAEHAHELAEGRLENTAQVELLNAIREMSRAEARLNAGDTATALPFERAALRALQRAFDRRRYLLRTMPERTRIDPARRLSGDRAEARPSAPAAAERSEDAMVGRARDAMQVLSRELVRFRGVDSSAAVAILRVDPDSERLQALAARLSSATARDARRAVTEEAQRELAAIVQRRLAPPANGAIARDPLSGRVAEQLMKRGSGR